MLKNITVIMQPPKDTDASTTKNQPTNQSTSGDGTARDSARRRNRRRAIAVSIVFHLVLISVLFFWYIPMPSSSNSGESRTASTDAATPVAEARRADPVTASSQLPSTEVPPEQIEASIASQIDAVTTLPDERKLSELEKNLSRLEAIASEESVRDVTTTIAASLGLKPGPVAANQPPDGPFDSDSAQILDVKREKDSRGQWQYISVLVDAKGRTQEVPLPETEGETAFQTFEQLKQYPIADGIYRQVVMPMIQKMIQASELAEQAATAAQQAQRESSAATDASDRRRDDSSPPQP